jgi:signal transduction histidine kinase
MAYLHAMLPLAAFGQSVPQAPPAPLPSQRLIFTNTSHFRTISGADYLAGVGFRLTGVITLIDTNRSLLVLQDSGGAIALSPLPAAPSLCPGQSVTLESSECSPFRSSFPDYPYHPLNSDIRDDFEVPMNWGEYHLTRMRGFLIPPTNGDYTFWIASDNSSELWLGNDANPAKARKIAFIPRFSWANPHEWNKFSFQRSEPIHLLGGERYYIEALQEQTTEGEHLSVAWEGPGLGQSVISGKYLSPWSVEPPANHPSAAGILREYWTNYTSGDLSGLHSAPGFESALATRNIRATLQGPGRWPKPLPILLNQPCSAENRYRWVETEGTLSFRGTDGPIGVLELTDGQQAAPIHALELPPELERPTTNLQLQIRGVWEANNDGRGSLLPGIIWAPTRSCISLIDTGASDTHLSRGRQPQIATNTSASALQGFYGTFGVVTFNDRVFGKDLVFIQEDINSMRIDTGTRPFLSAQFPLGMRVELGGGMEPAKPIPVITPFFITQLGLSSLPIPVAHFPNLHSLGHAAGRWCEFSGVVHAANSNGTLSLLTDDGPVYVWLGQTEPALLSHYVDAAIRARGVLMLEMLDAPLLLVPARRFVETDEAAPQSPFAINLTRIADIHLEHPSPLTRHRVRIAGQITHQDDQGFFLQDVSGAIRVRIPAPFHHSVGETVQVVGFPTPTGFTHQLTDPLLRTLMPAQEILPRELDLRSPLVPYLSGSLIQITATLLAQTRSGSGQMLELQQAQRVFTATIPASSGELSTLQPGSKLRLTGICDTETSITHTKQAKTTFLAPLNILLRTPQDVLLVSAPPWWTWRRTAALVGILLTVLSISLLWVYLLRRRLEKQQAAQLAFSKHVLERLEEERRRIAANLHDSLGQTLLVIKNHTMLALRNPVEVKGEHQRLDEISSATSQAIEEIRRITHGLRPYQLDRLGLSQAIRASVNQAAQNCSIQFASLVEEIDGVFTKDAEIHVYRIAQEAVTNIVKHSRATEATVVVKKRTASITLALRDNGCGFDPAKPTPQSHDLGHGLSGIAERVRILGGTMSIDSHPGAGANLTVEIPLLPSGTRK